MGTQRLVQPGGVPAHHARSAPANDRDETHRAGQHQHQVRCAEGATALRRDHDAEQQHGEHVVDHRGAKNHLALDAVQRAQFLQYPCGDASGGRHERGGDKHRTIPVEAVAVRPHAGHQERHDHTDHANQKRNGADFLQILQPRFQADGKQQQDHANLGEHIQCRPRCDLFDADPAQHGWTDYAAGDDLADHTRQFQPLRHLATELGRNKHDEQGEQNIVVHAPRVSHPGPSAHPTCTLRRGRVSPWGRPRPADGRAATG